MRRNAEVRGLLIAAAWVWVSAPVSAAGLVLSGLMGDQAAVVIDGAPRVVRAGAVIDGVRVLSVGREGVEVEQEGRRLRLTLQGTVAVQDRTASPSGGDGREGHEVRLGADGLYVLDGKIQGTSVRGVIDTGASLMAIPQRVADALRLSTTAGGRAVTVQTASGRTTGQRVVVPEMSFAGVTLRDIDAVVVADLPTVLWGHSVLRAFQITTSHGRMSLKPASASGAVKS